MKSLSGVLAFSALVALSVSSSGCAKLKELLKEPQPQKPTNVRPAQDYAFANAFCEKAETLGQAVKDTVKAVQASAEKSLASAGASIAKVQAERKAAGEDRTSCQIAEDVVEYGAEYARGKNVAGDDAPTLSLENQQSFDIAVVAALSVKSLNLNTVRADTIAPLAKSPRLKTLWLTAVPFSDLSPVGSVKSLRELTLDNCAVVSDLGPITFADGLERVALTNMRFAATRSSYHPLRALKNLKALDLRGSDFPSTSMLPDAKLEELRVDQQNFGDAELAQIAATYPALVNLSFRTPLVRDLSPLARMTALAQLELPAGAYQNLEALRSVTTLTSVQVRDLAPTDLAVLSGLPNLTVLSVDAPFRNVTDLAGLGALRKVRSLRIGYVGDLQNLDALAGLPELETLDFSDFGGRIFSIAAVNSIPKLVAFTVNFAKVQDISPLFSFLDTRKTAQVMLNGCELQRSQEQLNNTLREKFGARYTANVTIQR